MLRTLIAVSLLLNAAPAQSADDPPIRLRLSDDALAPGDHAHVKVKTARDGYLLVLHMDADRHVRVLFPIDPQDDGSIKGGHEFEVRGRGDREAITVSQKDGGGLVFAAVADQPFRFADFTRSGHWDLAALAPDSGAADPEAALLDLADRMSDGHYDYDAATYTVSARRYPRVYAGWYDPWFFGYYPWYGPRFGFRVGLGFRHFGHRGWRW